LEEVAVMKLRSFGKGFTVFEDRLASDIVAEEQVLARDVEEFEAALAKVGG